MTDQKFYKLQKDLQEAMEKVAKLQDTYRKETGTLFVYGQPIVKPKKG